VRNRTIRLFSNNMRCFWVLLIPAVVSTEDFNPDPVLAAPGYKTSATEHSCVGTELPSSSELRPSEVGVNHKPFDCSDQCDAYSADHPQTPCVGFQYCVDNQKCRKFYSRITGVHAGDPADDKQTCYKQAPLDSTFKTHRSSVCDGTQLFTHWKGEDCKTDGASIANMGEKLDDGKYDKEVAKCEIACRAQDSCGGFQLINPGGSQDGIVKCSFYWLASDVRAKSQRGSHSECHIKTPIADKCKTPSVGTSTPPAGTSTPPTGTSTPPAGSSTPPAGSSTPPTGSSTPPTGSSTPPAGSSTPSAGSSTPAAGTSTRAAGTSTPADDATGLAQKVEGLGKKVDEILDALKSNSKGADGSNDEGNAQNSDDSDEGRLVSIDLVVPKPCAELISVPVPTPRTVDVPVPCPVTRYQDIPCPSPCPVPVPVPVTQTVHVRVPVPNVVERRVPIPVTVQVQVPNPVPTPVPNPIPCPVPQTIQQRVPVPVYVDKFVDVPVPVPVPMAPTCTTPAYDVAQPTLEYGQPMPQHFNFGSGLQVAGPAMPYF